MRRIGELAEQAGVSVRTLRHYDAIGLLAPSERSGSGYRMYSRADQLRLREILVWRELDFRLEEIKAVLDDPGHDRVEALRDQLELIRGEGERLARIARAVERALAAEESNQPIKEDDMFEEFDHEMYVDEAERRWGGTDAWKQSQGRIAGYDADRWAQIEAAGARIEADWARLMGSGEPADGPEAVAIAKRHREHIGANFYDCSAEMHRSLAELYVEDARFAAHYERRAEGLAAYVRDSIVAASAKKEVGAER